jgi:hypothetical protein
MDSGNNADESYLGIRLADLEHVDDVPGLAITPSVGIHRKYRHNIAVVTLKVFVL